MAEILDKAQETGPFYHGTRADLKIGDFLTAGFRSNYNENVIMNHVYFTALKDGAGFAVELAKGENPARVYQVEPTGDWENDPNVTDKKFLGNPMRSYRSAQPLRIVAEVEDWARRPEQEIALWREKMQKPVGEILN